MNIKKCIYCKKNYQQPNSDKCIECNKQFIDVLESVNKRNIESLKRVTDR